MHIKCGLGRLTEHCPWPVKLESERLLLRAWTLDDAEAMFKYAKDERVGPLAGWMPHKSVEDSAQRLRDMWMRKDSFALVLKESGEVVGAIEATVKNYRGVWVDEYWEIMSVGYWLGVPFWGLGLMTEALKTMTKYLFVSRDCWAVECSHAEGNDRSRRVLEKCGFQFLEMAEMQQEELGTARMELVYRKITDKDNGSVSSLLEHRWKEGDSEVSMGGVLSFEF